MSVKVIAICERCKIEDEWELREYGSARYPRFLYNDVTDLCMFPLPNKEHTSIVLCKECTRKVEVLYDECNNEKIKKFEEFMKNKEG